MKIKDFFKYSLPDFFRGKGWLFWLVHFPLIILLTAVFIGTILYTKWYFNWLGQKEDVFSQFGAFRHHVFLETNPEYRNRYGDTGPGRTLKNFGFPSTIYDINGEKIGEFSEERRIYVSLKEVSPLFIKSLLVSEDINFMKHKGVDYSAIIRAAYNTIFHFKRGGGSTITQQLAKLLFTQREISIKRKVFEMFCAKAIEKNHTKKEILLMYVNLIYFGNGANGIEYASRLYFSKSASQLNIAEASFLSSIILNPTYFSPFRNRKTSKGRHLRVLKAIQQNKPKLLRGRTALQVHTAFWNTHSFDRSNLKHTFTFRSNYAPYVIETVRRELIERLSQVDLRRGGYKIYTTIDKNLQIAAKQELQRGIEKWRDHIRGRRKYRKFADEFEGALISIDPRTSQIKALVGGYEFTSNNQLNRVYQAKRQVGSAFKPIVYLSALDLEAFTPWSLVSDRPLTMKVRGPTGRMEDWTVNNGMKRYMLDIPISKALEVSSNVAAVRVIKKIGMRRLRKIVQRALDLSNAEVNRRFPDKVWSIALGTTDMTPYEVATLYSAVANKGYSIKPYLIKKIVDNRGSTIYEVPDNYGQNGTLIVNNRESIYLIQQMMKQVVTGSHGTGGGIRRFCNFNVAGKTGSSQKYRDQWFVGYNNELCTVAWLGADSNASLVPGMYGGNVAGPIWGQYMKKAKNYINFTPMTMPGNLRIVRLRIDQYSGLVARENMSEGVINGFFISGTEPGDYSDWPEEKRKWLFLKPDEIEEAEQRRNNGNTTNGSEQGSNNSNSNQPDEIQFENSPGRSTNQNNSQSQGNNSTDNNSRPHNNEGTEDEENRLHVR